jgi:hypothetical protein
LGLAIAFNVAQSLGISILSMGLKAEVEFPAEVGSLGKR